MSKLRLHLYGNPVLDHKIPELDQLPDDFDQLIEQMLAIMHAEEGIGLSANQAGLKKRFFVADFSLYDNNLSTQVFINPKILSAEGETLDEEGCLSLPGIREKISRAQKIKLQYEDRDGEALEEVCQDYLARVIQHEVDHLNGKFIVDHVSSLKKSFLNSKLERIADTEAKQADIDS